MTQRRRRLAHRPGAGGALPGAVAAPALVALVALVALSIPLAAAGPALVPGAATDAPAWLLGIFGEGLGLSPAAFLGLLYAALIAWALAAAGAAALSRRLLLGAGAALIALFALAPPLLSLDVFSYISYARLGVEHGLNPYDYPPAAIPGDEAAARVEDFRDAVSVYGPLFTLASYPLGALGVPAALWGLKAIAAASLAGIAALVARLAALRGVEPAGAAALVALNPLVLVHLVGGAHNDALMVLVAMLAIAAALAERTAGAGIALVGAAAIKASGALYAPFALAGSERRGRLAAAIVASALAVGAVALLVFGSSALEAVGVAGDNQATVSRWSVPGTVSRLSGADVDALRALLGAGFVLAVIWLLAWVARGGDWVRAAGWAAFALLIASAYMAPWYLIWLLPLAAISRDRVLIAGSVALSVLQAVNGVPL